METNDDIPGRYKTNIQIEFKSSILKSRLYDTNILESDAIRVANTGKAAALNNKMIL